MIKKYHVGAFLLLIIVVITTLLFWLPSSKNAEQKQVSEVAEKISPITIYTSPISPPPSSPVTPPLHEVTLPKDLTPSNKSLGVVAGAVVDPKTYHPIPNVDLYLGKLEGMEDNFPTIVMRQDNSPYAVSDERGYFIFMDVPPGKYGLIAWSPASSVLANDPQDMVHTLIIDVEPNKVVNLNVLPVDVP